MIRFWRWRLVHKDELSYLRGTANGARKMQRSAAKFRDWNESQQRKLKHLREQIACDQEYIDKLEACVSADDLKKIRVETSALRQRRAQAAAE